MFGKKQGPTPLSQSLADQVSGLADYLAAYGFVYLGSHSDAFDMRGGTWHIFTAEHCDFAFGFAHSPFWCSDSFLIGDPGTLLPGGSADGISMTNYVPDFFDRFVQERDRGAANQKAALLALQGHVDNAIMLFQHVRSQGRWLPLRKDREVAGQRPNNSFKPNPLRSGNGVAG